VGGKLKLEKKLILRKPYEKPFWEKSPLFERFALLALCKNKAPCTSPPQKKLWS